MDAEEPSIETFERIDGSHESPEAARPRRLDPANRIRRKTRAIMEFALRDFGLSRFSHELGLVECAARSALKKEPTDEDLVAYATENVFGDERLVDWLDALERKAHRGNERKTRSTLEGMVWNWKQSRARAA